MVDRSFAQQIEDEINAFEPSMFETITRENYSSYNLYRLLNCADPSRFSIGAHRIRCVADALDRSRK